MLNVCACLFLKLFVSHLNNSVLKLLAENHSSVIRLGWEEEGISY